MAAIDISGTNGPGLTLVTNADSTSGFSGQSGQLDTTEYYQGSGSYTYQSGKNSRSSCTFTPSSNLDWSLADGHFYFSMKCAVFAFAEDKTTGTSNPSGLTCRVTDGSNNYKEWHIAGADTWDGSWKQFVVDLSNTSEIYAQSGTLDLTDIDEIEFFVDLSNSGNIRIIDNTWLDVMYFGTGIVVTGTDASFDAAFQICDSGSNKYPIIHQIEGVNFIQGKVQFGDGGGTSTTCTSTNEVVIFRDATVKSGLYEISASSATMDISSATIQAAGTSSLTRYSFDMSGASSCSLKGSALTRASTVDFASGQTIQNVVFNNCGQIDPSSSTFENNTISNSVDTGGALLWPGGTTTNSCTFINNDKAVEITQTSNQSFSGLVFDDVSGKYDVHLNNGGTSIEVAKTNGSNPNSYTATGGGTVTFTASFNLTLTNIEENTQVTIVDSSTRAELQNSSAPASGIVTYTHGGGDTVDVMFMHLDYDPNLSDIFNLTLPNGDSTVKIQQIDDANYDNPA